MRTWVSGPGALLRECDLGAPVSVPATATLRDAAQAMREHDVSCVLVGDPQRPLSVLTERDLADATARGVRPTSRVSALATEPPLTISDAATVRAAGALMLYHGIRHLVVVDGGRAVGVVSMRDALASLARVDNAEVFAATVHQALTTRPECWLG